MDQSELNRQLQAFLIGKREAAQLSQSDVAARSDVFGMGKTLDQRAVSRIEQQPLGADAIKIAGYMSAVGASPQQYYDFLSELTYKKDEGVTMMQVDTTSQRISQALNKVAEAQAVIKQAEHAYLSSLNLDESFDQISELLRGLNRKPIIGCFGHFDAGKSTLINSIINHDLLPAHYQPATCVVNILMHVDERPASLTGSVALFRKGFKPHMIHDREKVGQYLIEEGDRTLLDRLGVHNFDESIPSDAYIAILFFPADILRGVWLMDTPGDLNSADDGDTEKALGGVELVDGIVFLSPHTGFLKQSDLGFATNIIRQRPPLSQEHMTSHLLFVSSHSHSELSADDIARVKRTTFVRIGAQMESLVFGPWKEDGHITVSPTAEMLAGQIEPFWRENNTFRTQTLSRINEMASFLTTHQEALVDKSIARAISQIGGILDSAIETLEGKKESAMERIREVEAQDARFREKSGELIRKFKGIIASCQERKAADLSAMQDYCALKTSEEGLTELITETYSDKKEAQSEVGNYVGQLLSAKLESVLKSSGKAISNEVESLLSQWQRVAPNMNKASLDTDVGDMDFDISGFNSRAAFIGGLAGLGSLGAMSFYVSTIASNLGGYILIGKAAGVLVSLGLVGSVTTVTSFVAAIGGPITVGIVLAAAVGYLFYRLAGGSWQKSLAKKVAEAMRKEDVWGKVQAPVNQYWDSTERAISAGLGELIIQTDQHIDTLKLDANKEYSVSELDYCIAVIERAESRLDLSAREPMGEAV